jgi:hypothetical protein
MLRTISACIIPVHRDKQSFHDLSLLLELCFTSSAEISDKDPEQRWPQHLSVQAGHCRQSTTRHEHARRSSSPFVAPRDRPGPRLTKRFLGPAAGSPRAL